MRGEDISEESILRAAGLPLGEKLVTVSKRKQDKLHEKNSVCKMKEG